MRKVLLVIMIALIGIKSYGQTNVYHAFPDSNAWWGEEIAWIDINQLPFPPIYDDKNKLFMAGDTIIGSYHYQKLAQSGLLSYSDPHTLQYYSDYYFNTYEGAIRQDTLLKTIYFIPPDSSMERLLYDFSLSLGDSLPVSYNNGYSNNYVTRIDSIHVGNNYRKMYKISNPQYSTNCVLIEGIGGSFGLLYPLNNYNGIDWNASLNCFHWDNQVYLNNDSISTYFQITTDSTYDCNLDVGIKEPNPIPPAISLYPNPNNGTFMLNCQLTIDNCLFKIMDVCGRTMYETSIRNMSIVNYQLSIPLASGIYFWQLLSDDGLQIHPNIIGKGKVIVIKD